MKIQDRKRNILHNKCLTISVKTLTSRNVTVHFKNPQIQSNVNDYNTEVAFERMILQKQLKYAMESSLEPEL